MSTFVVIEGLDGAGKSTQIRLLRNYFQRTNLKYKFFHFPRINCPIYGELISKFLRGEFGGVNDVNPYFAALLFAGDRNEAKKTIRKYLNNGYFVLADRYVFSNIAFQGAKINNVEEKLNFKHWIQKLELEYNGIPIPNMSIYLHLPSNLVIERLRNERRGVDRHYLKGKRDIHEGSAELQKQVEKEYIDLAKTGKKFFLLNCFSETKGVLGPQEIHQKIVKFLKRKNLV